MRVVLLLIVALPCLAQLRFTRDFASGSVTVTPGAHTETAVTGLPWSGMQAAETILADGTHMSESSVRYFRDSMGRIRRENSNAGWGPTPVVEISDPVAGHSFVLDPTHQAAYRIPLSAQSRAGSQTARPCPSGGGADSESLGTRTIQGVPACGMRRTNFEMWSSANDIGGVLLNRFAGPNNSTNVTEVRDLKFSEPAAELFAPPSGYRIVDETGPFTIPGLTPPANARRKDAEGRTYTALTGLPFSAEIGIQGKTLNRFYRDSFGRTRREMLAGSGAFIEVLDPVAGYRYTIEPAKKTVHRKAVVFVTKAATAATAPPVEAKTETLGGGVIAVNVPLGSKTIDGVETWGISTTLNYPPGTMNGNDHALAIVNEAWTSPKLGIAVQTNNSHPLAGDFTSTMRNLTYAEPDAALFQIPDGYQIVDDH